MFVSRNNPNLTVFLRTDCCALTVAQEWNPATVAGLSLAIPLEHLKTILGIFARTLGMGFMLNTETCLACNTLAKAEIERLSREDTPPLQCGHTSKAHIEVLRLVLNKTPLN